MGNRYHFPDSSIDVALRQKVLTEKQPVLVYGCYGEQCAGTLLFLEEKGIRVEALLDGNPVAIGTAIHGFTVIDAQAYVGVKYPVIICADNSYRVVEEQLRQLGYHDLLPYYFYYCGRDFDFSEYRKLHLTANRIKSRAAWKDTLETKGAIILPSIDVVLTERCSLRCKDCSNLMQYYTQPKDEDFTLLLRALDRLMSTLDFVFELRVLGGEPFIAEHFVDCIKHLLQYKNFSTIVVYSNGTIFPKADAIDCLADQRVFVRFSKYGQLSKKLGKFEAEFTERGIFYDVVPVDKWQDCSGFQKRDRTEDELRDTYLACCTAKVYTLKNGRLYGCPFEANAISLQAVPSDADGSIDICSTTSETLRNSIAEMQLRPYYSICDYCHGRPRVFNIPAAVQASQPLSYIRRT